MESVNLVSADPPYNTRSESNRKNTSYDKLTDKETDVFEVFVKTFLERVGHSVVLCSNYQVRRFYQVFF